MSTAAMSRGRGDFLHLQTAAESHRRVTRHLRGCTNNESAGLSSGTYADDRLGALRLQGTVASDPEHDGRGN